MKLEQDTPTREYTWSETNSSETDQVLDKWWETNDGRHAKVHRRKSQTPPLRRQLNWDTNNLGNTLRETHDERQVKAKNRRPESRTPLDRVGNKWRETCKFKERNPESRAPPARLGDKWIGRQPESRTPPGKRRTPLKKELIHIDNPKSKLFGEKSHCVVCGPIFHQAQLFCEARWLQEHPDKHHARAAPPETQFPRVHFVFIQMTSTNPRKR